MHALPVELIARIFTFYTEVPDNLFLPYPVWLPITHVCHHWRTVALSHAPLWTSITRGLSLRWIKAFMERSRTMLMNFDIRIAPLGSDIRTHDASLYNDYVILLLAEFTRVRSLHLTGCYHTISPIVDSLRSSLPIQSLSLCLEDDGGWRRYILPDDLFGGKAPIRRLQLVGASHIVAPHWLLRGVTHFTGTLPMLFSELLDALRQMSALTYFETRPSPLCYMRSDVDKLRTSPIQMPQLMNLIVGANIPDEFILLNQLLLLPVGAKRRLVLRVSVFYSFFDVHRIDGLSPVVEAANGFQHIHFSGAQTEPCFRLWTGNAATTWEDAEFCLYAEWGEVPRYQRYLHGNVSASHLIALCDVLGAARVHRLVIDSPSLGMSKSYWWELLEKLPGIEELELYPASVGALGGAWMENRAKRAKRAPAVLSALRRVRIVASEIGRPSPQYAIIGDIPARRIVRLPNSTEGDITSSPEAVSADKELENMSSGLLRLLQGLGRDLTADSGKRKGKKGRR